MISPDCPSSVNLFSQHLFWNAEKCRKLCELAGSSNHRKTFSIEFAWTREDTTFAISGGRLLPLTCR